MKIPLAALLSLTVLLTACGEDDDTTDASTPTAPESIEAQPEPSVEEEDELDAEEPEPILEADEPDSGSEAEAAAGFSLVDFRYCEILMTVEGDDGEPVTEVWGTPGVGPCEDEAWYALDPDALMAENDASAISMNGPRYFTSDGGLDTAPAEPDGPTSDEAPTRTFGDVGMTLLATVGEPVEAPTPYESSLVVRTETFTYNAGTEVYQLIDPNGDVYYMQSYALIHDTELTLEGLPTLADRLDLPDGWSYNVEVLDADLQLGLTSDGAIVVQDELENSYQRNG